MATTPRQTYRRTHGLPLAGKTRPFRKHSLLHKREPARFLRLASEEHYRGLMDASPVPMVLCDGTEQIHHVNPVFVKIFGYTLEDIPNWTAWSACAYPEAESQHQAIASLRSRKAELLGSKEPTGPVVTDVHCANGTMRTISASISRVAWGTGQTLILVTLVDITDQLLAGIALRESDQQLKESEILLSNAQELAKIGGWHVTFGRDTTEDCWSASPELRKIFGFSEDQLMTPRSSLKLMPVEDQRRILGLWKSAIRGEGPREWEYCIDVNGETKWIRTVVRIIFDDQGIAREVYGASQDITESRRSELARRVMEDRFRMLFGNMAEGVGFLELVYGPDGHAENYRLLDVNAAHAEHSGFLPADVIGKLGTEIFGLPEAPDLDIYVKSVETGRAEEFESYVASMDKHFRVRCIPVGPKQFAQIFEDITRVKRAEAELRIAATAFESQIAIVVTDEQARILRANSAFEKITGYNAGESVGKTPAMLKSGCHDENFYRAMWESIRRDGFWQGEIWNRRKNGELYPELLGISAVYDEDGRVTNYIGNFTDVTRFKEADEQIHQLAYYDPLTGLPNRRLLYDRLRHILAANARHDRHCALLFIDLDHFKKLNDTKGHGVGDLMLSEAALRLKASIREGDTVARFGGDEFVVMLEDLDEDKSKAAAQVEVVGDKILVELNRPFLLHGYEHRSSASVGICLFCDQESTEDELFKRADSAMYQAKAAGRNTLRFFDPEMQSALEARAVLERDLHGALFARQFALYYQMQVDHRGQIHGAEVLLRWKHPERGLVSPMQFIPLAEETGLILPIGHWVLDTACAQLKSWANDPLTSELRLSVNVSARQFHHPGFVGQVIALLDQYSIDPGRLKLELTESAVLNDIDDAIEKMQVLKQNHVHFSMDDFGTGYSSLSYLTRLPLTQLKIDQSFVRNIGANATDAVIAQTIIGMANNLGMEVIAEGVETETQRRFLEQHGCPMCQGYLFGKPVPIEEFESSLLVTRNSNDRPFADHFSI